ncbi:LysR family transcriptional regulator [Consotaella aegiceratis]|uniref:LysR family transcriptional regulator n=1 Tax=Consotaella aegiceratis TaxID=3097961 RepID=UPI002F411E40
MDWDDVRVFLAVARTGQILAASRRLGLNHATVGRRVSALEADLGARLLDRHPQGCALTPDGEAFFQAAERMEEEMTAARQAVGSMDADLSGTVRIGAPDGFGTAFLAPRLGALLERHPALTLQLVPVPRAFSISRREADLAITIDRPVEGRLVVQKLVDYSLGLYAATSYLDRHGRPDSEEALLRHGLIGHVDDLIYSPVLNYAGEIVRNWPSRFEISGALGQTEAVTAGAGIGILHAFIANSCPGLERILPGREVRRSYWMVFHESGRHLRRIRVVAEFIRDCVAAERSLFA